MAWDVSENIKEMILQHVANSCHDNCEFVNLWQILHLAFIKCIIRFYFVVIKTMQVDEIGQYISDLYNPPMESSP